MKYHETKFSLDIHKIAAAAAILLIFSAQSSLAQPESIGVLYSQNFDINDTANWRTNNNGIGGIGTNAANYFFDYSTIGIPPAPNSKISTRGLKLGSNLDPSTAPTSDMRPALSVSPIGKSFSGDITLTFDWWHNYIGPLNTGAAGSTMLSTFGILTSGTTVNYAGASDGVFFAATGDGGSGIDYRVYSIDRPNGFILGFPEDISATYFANSQNHEASYYVDNFPGGVSAPSIQQINFPTQSGSTPAGTIAFGWHEVEIKKTGNVIAWKIDGVLIATLDRSIFSVNTGGTNILFGHSDTNNTTSAQLSFPLLQFTLIDNIQVTSSIPGDFDQDGDVDGRDFLVWQHGGSPNGINSGDLALWQAQYGMPLTATARAVPEPGSFLLTLTGVLLVSISRK